MKGGKYTILSVAKTVSEDKLEHGTHKLASYIQWVKKGYRRLNEDTLQTVRTTSLVMNDYNAVDLSEIDDFVDWTKVGVQYGDKVLVLGTADDIALLNAETDCGDLIKNRSAPSLDDVINGINLDAYIPYWFSGYYGDGIYSGTPSFTGCYTGLPYKGFFTENKERNQLQFSSNVNIQNVYIEYISDGTCPNGETEIDSRCFDYLTLFCHYEAIRNRRDVPGSEKYRVSEELFYELGRLKKIINPMTKQDIINHFRKGIRMDSHI